MSIETYIASLIWMLFNVVVVGGFVYFTTIYPKIRKAKNDDVSR